MFIEFRFLFWKISLTQLLQTKVIGLNFNHHYKQQKAMVITFWFWRQTFKKMFFSHWNESQIF